MTSPQTLLKAWNLYPKKQLGQHFLSDPSTAEMIIRRAEILSEDIILEIGSGLGAITIPAARASKKVYAVDNDKQLIRLLNTELLVHQLSNVVLIEKDILKLNISELFENEFEDERQKFIVMGNLPYNISSQILILLIKSRIAVKKAVLMIQKELAERMLAQPCSKDYGRLTVMLRYCSDIKLLANVKSSLFFPRPQVDSQVIEIKFKDAKYPVKDEAFFFKVIKAAFGQRRKTLKNALSGSEFHMDSKIADKLSENTEIDFIRRAETLSTEEFVILSNALYDIYHSMHL
jgi:16S rRNA (adenine1518-N6/adenine1519-N6)-dimethyltransferase